MSESKIEWTDATWNPVTGCRWKSPGCDNCYAATMARRLEAMGQEKYQGLTTAKHFNGTVKTWEDTLTIPLRWRKPRMVFVNSMSDLFHPDVPFEFIDKVFAVMALCEKHTFQVLTKRPDRMAEYLLLPYWQSRIATAAELVWDEPHTYDFVHEHLDIHGGVLPNVWPGTSAEDQERADERVPHLLRCPAAVRFISAEPLLGPIDFDKCRAWNPRDNGFYLEGIDLVIAGGESGPGARECDIANIRSIQLQCQAAGVAFFDKQWGKRPVVRNDGTHNDWLLPWLDSGQAMPHEISGNGQHDSQIVFHPRHPKGGDMSEWPDDLRVRQFPQVEKVTQ